MAELEVKRCVVSNLQTGETVVLRFGEGESHPELFPSREDTHLLVEMEIGEKGLAAADLFSIQMATVEALHDHHLQPGRGANGKYLVLAGCCRWETVEAKLVEMIRTCTGYSYADCCETLRRHFDWEYEGMR